MTREKWLKERQKGLGGSDASSVTGMNPYKTNIQLWEEKTGRRVAEDISEKEYVKYGTEAEQHLRELFKLDYPKYEVTSEENNIIKHKEYPFLFASLDGQIVDTETGEMGVLEIKTTNILNSMHKEKWKDKIPDNYYIQILHYLMVTGYSFAKLVAQLKYSDEYKHTKVYTISRNECEEDIKLLQEKEIEFWTKNVMADRKPNLILPGI
jgi:putative phage-type endonuclease